MIDNLRDRIAAAITGIRIQRDGDSYKMADAVIADLQPELIATTLAASATNARVTKPSYADNFCRGGCDCSCCYGMADEPCHCRDAICNCGGDRAAHGQKPL